MFGLELFVGFFKYGLLGFVFRIFDFLALGLGLRIGIFNKFYDDVGILF